MRNRSVAGDVTRLAGPGPYRRLSRLAFKLAFVGGIVAACSPFAFHDALVEHLSESTHKLPAWMVISNALADGPIEGDARYRGIGRGCANFDARFLLESTEGRRADRGAGLRYTVRPEGPFPQRFDFVTRHPMMALDRSDVFDESNWFELPQNIQRWRAMVISSPQGSQRALRRNPGATVEKLTESGSLRRAFEQVADGKYPRNFVKQGLNSTGQPCVYDVRLTPDPGTFAPDADVWPVRSEDQTTFLERFRALLALENALDGTDATGDGDSDTTGGTDSDISGDTDTGTDSTTPLAGPRTVAAYVDLAGNTQPRIDPTVARLVDEFLADLPQPGRITAFATDPRDDAVVCDTGMPAPPGASNDLAWAADLLGDDGRQRTYVGTWGDMQASLEQDYSFALLVAGLSRGMDPLLIQTQVHAGETATGRLDGDGVVIPGTESDVIVTGQTAEFRLPEGAGERVATFVQGFGTKTMTSDRLCDDVALLDNMADLDTAASRQTGEDACVASATRLCLQDGRFRVEASWRDFADQTGPGTAIDLDDPTSGLFFGGPEQDWEALVKVLNGCEFNDHFWVFAAAHTTIEYGLTVTDTVTGDMKNYTNPLGRPAPAITDTSAFATCP